MSEPKKTAVNIKMPEAAVTGAYADFVSIWHTKDYFVFDFAALATPPMPGTTNTGEKITQLQAQIVSRVRIPPSQAIEIMKGLGQQLDHWEKESGKTPPAE